MRRKETIKCTCVICKKEFNALRSDAKTCSDSCRSKYSRIRRNTKSVKQSKLIKAQDKLISSIPGKAIKNKQSVTNYILSQIELYKAEGYDWIRMELIRNFSHTLFGTPGTVPDKFSIGGYDFEKINSTRYSFKKA